MTSYYPVFLKVSQKRCVVVGGGEVAWRKARALLECGANVTVISPGLCSQLNKLAEKGEIRIIRRPFQKEDLKGAFIAVACAGDRAVNLQVSEEARKMGIPTNAADDPASSDFIVPSYFTRGDLTIAISTSGKSPALARKIRLRLEKEFGDAYASLALLIDEVRTGLKRDGVRINGDVWQKALDLDRLIDLIKKGDGEKAKTILLGSLKHHQGNY